MCSTEGYIKSSRALQSSLYFTLFLIQLFTARLPHYSSASHQFFSKNALQLFSPLPPRRRYGGAHASYRASSRRPRGSQQRLGRFSSVGWPGLDIPSPLASLLTRPLRLSSPVQEATDRLGPTPGSRLSIAPLRKLHHKSRKSMACPFKQG